MNQPPNNWGQPPQGGFQGQPPQQQQGAFGQPAGQAPGGWGQPQGGYPAQPGGGYPPQAGANPYQAPQANPYGGHGHAAPVKPDIKQILFSFEGRASRAHYWLYGVGLAIAVGVVGGILTALLDEVGLFISLALYLPLIWTGLAVSIKRWHDRGKSGWWIFISLVPMIGGLWHLVECGFLEGDAGPNEYGPPVA